LTEEAEGAAEDEYFDVDMSPLPPITYSNWQWNC